MVSVTQAPAPAPPSPPASAPPASTWTRPDDATRQAQLDIMKRRATGLLALAGGVSVILGYKARVGAWLLVLFLVPVTLTMHAFWAVQDPMMAQMQQAMFLKNLSMIGGALMIAYHGPGPLSLDERRRAASSRTEPVIA